MGKKRFGNVFSNEPLSEHVKEFNDNMAKNGGGGDGDYTKAEYLNIEEEGSAEVLFLEQHPIKFWQHRVFDKKLKKNKGGWRVFSCTRQPDCPLCVAGDSASFKVAWNVLHIDDPNGPKVKLWVKGIKFAELFEKKTGRFDITKERVILERVGKGTSTIYTIDRTNETKVPKYDHGEIVDLEDYFGLDDEKYADMERIAETFESDAGGASNRGSERTGRRREEPEEEYRPSKGRKHQAAEEEEEEEEERPRRAGGRKAVPV